MGLGHRLSSTVRFSTPCAPAALSKMNRISWRIGRGCAGASRDSKLRKLTSVPLTHGEEWGHRWDFFRSSRTRTDYIGPPCPTWGHHGDDEDAARAKRTPSESAALHRSHCHCGVGPHARPFLRSCASRSDQHFAANHIQEGLDFRKAMLAESAARFGSYFGDEPVDADRRSHRARKKAVLLPPGRFADALVSIRERALDLI